MSILESTCAECAHYTLCYYAINTNPSAVPGTFMSLLHETIPRGIGMDESTHIACR